MCDRKKTDQEILNAKIAPLEERWSPFREDSAIPVDEESMLQTLANAGNESARSMLLIARNWQGPVVPRKKIKEFMCGLLSPKTMANLDCDKVGPDGKDRFGRLIIYDKWKLVWWMFERYCNRGRQKKGNRPQKRSGK
jgi:hypothetical protein